MDRVLSHSRYSEGFTLMEVLVALAVLAIALTSIYRLQGQTFLMSASARFYNQAPQLAQMKLSEVETQNFKEITGGNGDFGNNYPGYAWAVSVEEIPSDLITSQQYHLTRIEITVSNDDENTYHLQTYRFFSN